MLVDNAAILNAKQKIDELKGKFETMGGTLIGDLEATFVKDRFEGKTKEALMKKIGSAQNVNAKEEETLAYFVMKQVPDLLGGLSELLEGNRQTIINCDENLAEAIK